MKYLYLLTVFFLLLPFISVEAQNPPLDVESTQSGALLPRMTTTQMNAISSPQNGMILFNTTTQSFWLRSNNSWAEMAISGIGIPNQIQDSDASTVIHTEQTMGDNKIRFLLDSTEHFIMRGPRIEVNHSNESVYLGSNSGGDMTAYANTVIGADALYGNTSGHSNCALGNGAMYHNISGDQNVGIGRRTLYLNSSGNSNTALGAGVLYNNSMGFRNSAIGRDAMFENTTGNNNISLGNESLKKNTTGKENVALGVYSLYYNKANQGSVAIGYGAMQQADPRTTGRLTYNTAIGYKSLFGSSSISNNTGRFNTSIGSYALGYNSTGDYNTTIGAYSLLDNTTGTDNTSVGCYALYNNVDGDFNISIGNYSSYSNSSGYSNVAIGSSSLYNNISGSHRSALGQNANQIRSGDINNTAIGYNATCSASNQVRVGNSSVTSIGGYENWTDLSDGRFKTQINENVIGLDFINALRPVTYYKDLRAIDDWWAENYGIRDTLIMDLGYEAEKNQIRYSGFLAQEVEAAAQALGYEFSGVDAPKNDKDYYGLRYAEFTVPLVKAVQELSDENDEMRVEIAELKKVEDRIRKLETALLDQNEVTENVKRDQ